MLTAGWRRDMTPRIEADKSPVRGRTDWRLLDAKSVRVRNNIEYVTDDQLGAILQARFEAAVLRPVYLGKSQNKKWYQTAVVWAFVTMLLYIFLFLNLLVGNMKASTFLGPVACYVLLVCAFGFWFAASLVILSQ